MKIESTAFGSQISDPESQIEFPQGLPGFEESTRFQLFHESDEGVVGHLQSLDDPDVSLSVLSPETINICYELSLSDEEQKLIGLENPDDAMVLLVAYKQSLNQVQGGVAKVNASFMAPLVINTRTRIGFQKVLQHTEGRITIRAE